MTTNLTKSNSTEPNNKGSYREASKPHALCVCYGGGHVNMMIPVIHQLQAHNYQVDILGLTIAGSILKENGLPFLGFKDFQQEEDHEAIQYGERLINDIDTSNVDRDESIAYLGFSYFNLVQDKGAELAAIEYKKHGRQAFLPLGIMRRIFDKINPNIVITTNSPRAERAAVLIAKERGIPNISLVDLFGLKEMYPLCSDHLCVLSMQTKKNLEKQMVKSQIHITGNPAFDMLHRYHKPVNTEWRQNNIQQGNKPCVTWLVQPAYWKLTSDELYKYSDNEMRHLFEALLKATKSLNATLLIRPHPSQSAALFESWCANYNDDEIRLVAHLPLYPLLNAVDAAVSTTSTSALEACLIGTPTLIIKPENEKTDMPLDEYGMAISLTSLDEITAGLERALFHKPTINMLRRASQHMLSQENSAKNVFKLIKQCTIKNSESI